MRSALLVVGNLGSGKSEVLRYFTRQFLRLDIPIKKQVSDRIVLEEAVLEDVKDVEPDAQGVKTGKYSQLLADGEPGRKKIHVLDGKILNDVHERMIASLAPISEEITLMEYALGPVFNFGGGKEPLKQDGSYLIELLIKYRVSSRAVIVEVKAPFEIRAKRQAMRPDPLPAETFACYFPDGGELLGIDKALFEPGYHEFWNVADDTSSFHEELWRVLTYF